MPFVIARDETRLFYECTELASTHPPRPWLCLLDGIGCDGFAWKHIQPIVGQYFNILHFHYRGHGRSGAPKDAARIGITAHAEDLQTVLDACLIDQVVLAGHSMGTQVALEAYRLMPERVRGLALFCGSYGRITETFYGSDILARVLPNVIAFVDEHRELVRGLWGRLPPKLAYRIGRLTGEMDATLREEDFVWYIEHVAKMTPELFLEMLRAAGEHSAEDLLPKIAVPTLVAAAERDTFTPASVARHMAEMIPHAELLELIGASHGAPVEQPEVISARFLRFCHERGIL